MSLTSVNMPLVYPRKWLGSASHPSSPSVGTGFCLSSGISPNPTLSPFISYSHLWSHIMIIFLLWYRNVSEGSWEILIIVCVKSAVRVKTLLLALAFQTLTYCGSLKAKRKTKSYTQVSLRTGMLTKNWNGRDEYDMGARPSSSQNTSDCSGRTS